jgi:hypothetical protein
MECGIAELCIWYPPKSQKKKRCGKTQKWMESPVSKLVNNRIKV